MCACSVPELEKCYVYDANLVDPLLKRTYKGLPRLPRYFHCHVIKNAFLLIFFISMADYAPTWGQQSDKGGFHFSSVNYLYYRPNIE